MSSYLLPFRRAWQVRGVRFLAVGTINTLTDIALLNVFVIVAGMPAQVANICSASISITMSYFLNHHLVFRSTEARSLDKFVRFFIITGLSVLLVQSAVITAVTWVLHGTDLGLNELFAYLGFTLRMSPRLIDLNVAKLCAVLCGMVWNFLLYRYIVFAPPPRPPAAVSD